MAQERYMALNGKYLQEAERLLEQGDYPQASEKFWGAVATALKAVASTRRWRHFNHRELQDVVRRLSEETGDVEHLALFSDVESMHANFYENFMTPEDVGHYANRARQLAIKLYALAGQGDRL